MFLFKMNDGFVSESIKYVFRQIKINLTFNQSDRYFATINCKYETTHLIFFFNNKNFRLKLPITTNEFVSEIMNILNSFSFEYANLSYNPIQQTLLHQNKLLHLGQIHNKIFIELILNLDSGLNKFELYRAIWPNDKNVYINKLDTHLTNLKNILKNQIHFQLNFTSTKSVIKLINN